MRHLFLSAFILALQLATVQLQAGDAATIRVITDRTEAHLKPLLAKFQETSGITVQAVYVEKGLLARVQANPTEADVVITAAVENLERARVGKLLRPFDSAALSTLPAQYLDEDKAYAIISYRARGFFVAKDRVAKGAIASYEDLLKPALKGKVLIRSGLHDYNIALFCQLAESRGLEWTRKFIVGLRENRARVPKGSDRDQVRAIKDGEGDVSVGNSYYMPIMLGNPEQKPWAEATRFVFPDQQGKGSIVMKAGAALTVADRAIPAATKLLEYLVDVPAQTYMATTLNEFSINPKVPVSDLNKTALGTEQAEVVDGRFKVDAVSVRAADKHRDAVVKILNDVNFDQ